MTTLPRSPGSGPGRRERTLRRIGLAPVAVCIGVAACAVGVGADQPVAQAKTRCIVGDPTAGGACIDSAAIETVQHTYVVNYTANNQELRKTFTAANDILRPLTYVDARVGPDQHMERVRIVPPCSYYRIYTGKRMFDYPAMDQFMAGTPETLANPPVPRSHWIFGGDIQRMQLPNGLGLVEQPWVAGTSDPIGGTGGVHTRYTGPIHLHLPQMAQHRTDDTGSWWDLQCAYDNYRAKVPSTTRAQWDQSVLGMLHQDAPTPAGQPNSYWSFWDRGQENPPIFPTPPFPPRVLLSYVIPGLHLAFAPDTAHAQARLATWMWETNPPGSDPNAAVISSYPISITSRGQTITATPEPLAITGLPPGATSSTRCARGGAPFTPTTPADATSDCSVTFATATPPGHTLPVTFTQNWKITVNGRPVAGAGGVYSTSTKATFTVNDSQAVGGH